MMDDTDLRLLNELSANARLSVTTLAGRLGLARTTVQARIERLERTGAIAGYTVRLGDLEDLARIRATVLVQIDPRKGALIMQRLRAMPGVGRAVTSSGRFDLVLQVSSRSTAELDTLLDEIGEMPGVKSSESLIHLSTKIDRGG